MPVLESLQQAIDRVHSLAGSAGYQDRQAHVFAVVLECTLPRRTRGTDFIVNVHLVDESRHCRDSDAAEQLQPVELIVFSKDAEHMPRVRVQPGDIIELRHVMVQFWDPPNGGPRKPQLFGKMNKPHEFGFLLYPARASAPQYPLASAEAPYQRFNAPAYGGQQASQKLAELRAFAAQLCSAGNPGAEVTGTYLRRLKDIEMPEDCNTRPNCVDLRVKVLAIDRRAPEHIVLYVWDGTDARPLPAQQQWLPCQWKGAVLDLAHLKCRRVLPLISEEPHLMVESNLPALGSVVPVIIEQENMPRNDLPSVGSWVKLKVVGLLEVQGQLQVVYGKDSRINACGPAGNFEQNLNNRISNNITSEFPTVEANIATSCSRTDLQLCTLRQVQQQVAHGQTGPFKVRVRLVGYYPREPQQWCKLTWKPVQVAPAADQGHQPAQEQQMQQDWDWAAQLLLEDATGNLRALLMGQHATGLLGLPPIDLAEHPDNVQQLKERLDYLTLVDQAGGIWMDVAVTAVLKGAAAQQQQQQQADQQQQQAGDVPLEDEDSAAQHQQLQQETHSFLPRHAHAAVNPASVSSTASIAAGACWYILHDAVCIEQQQEHTTLAAEVTEEPSRKRQRGSDDEAVRTEGPASAIPEAPAPDRHLGHHQGGPSASSRDRELRHAYAFM